MPRPRDGAHPGRKGALSLVGRTAGPRASAVSRGTRCLAMVYLDHAATSPLRPDCLEALIGAERGGWGNPSSPHAAGRRSRAIVEEARREVAELIGADPAQVVFTGGATEANNLAVLGTARVRPGRHIVLSAVEHHSVLEPCRHLGRDGWQVTEVLPGPDGVLDAGAIIGALRQDTVLCCLMLANNEVGALEPVVEVGQACRARGLPLLVDAVAAAGKVPVDVRTLGAHLVTLSPHKFGGPRGIGALWVHPDLELGPLLHGGGQERRWRPGTENVGAIAAAGVACRLARRELGWAGPLLARRAARLGQLVEQADLGAIPTGPASAVQRVPGLVSFAFPGLDGDALLAALDLRGVAAGSGAACSSGSRQSSHVLAAMGLAPAACRAALRFSLGTETGEDALEVAVGALEAAVRCQRASAGGG